MKTGSGRVVKGVKQWPEVKSVRRISKVRLERLRIILSELKVGKSVQMIAEERCLKLDRVWHEFYYLKRLGLLDPDFKNPSGTVYTNDLVKEIGNENSISSA